MGEIKRVWKVIFKTLHTCCTHRIHQLLEVTIIKKHKHRFGAHGFTLFVHSNNQMNINSIIGSSDEVDQAVDFLKWTISGEFLWFLI